MNVPNEPDALREPVRRPPRSTPAPPMPWAVAALRSHADHLGTWLTIWTARDDRKPDAGPGAAPQTP